VTEWRSDANKDLLEASHRGYSRLPEPVIHQRRVVFDKPAQTWTIEDELRGRGTHEARLLLHLSPDVVCRSLADGRFEAARPGDTRLLFDFRGANGVDVALRDGWASREYGTRSRIQVLECRQVHGLPVRLTTTIRVVRDQPGTLESRI